MKKLSFLKNAPDGIFYFKPLEKQDFGFLQEWYKEPHVAEWWEKESNEYLQSNKQSQKIHHLDLLELAWQQEE